MAAQPLALCTQWPPSSALEPPAPAPAKPKWRPPPGHYTAMGHDLSSHSPNGGYGLGGGVAMWRGGQGHAAISHTSSCYNELNSHSTAS